MAVPPPSTAALTQALFERIWSHFGTGSSGGLVDWTGSGDSPCAFEVTSLAAASIGAAARATAELVALISNGAVPAVAVDRRLASFWFSSSLRPEGWKGPVLWDSVAGDYQAQDGWIRLHTNAPHHRAAALAVLGVPGEREAVAERVAQWNKADLEQAIVAGNGCAAEMLTEAEWAAHEQGQAVAREPLVDRNATEAGPCWQPSGSAARPLAGVRVLDLTRVLAGPVSTRFLAALGASVLRIDPPTWDEPAIVPEMTVGKRCARLDLAHPSDRAVFEALLGGAHVLVHGYRPGALSGLGFGPDVLNRLAPGLVEVSLCAYGWTGPWSTRRGFDSLVQMSSGIAATGMARTGAAKPVPLPYQALDHATGYLMAACAVRGLQERWTGQHGLRARVSLARTARLLADFPTTVKRSAPASESPSDRAPEIEHTAWGPARRLRFPFRIEGLEPRWDRPATALGSEPACWPGAS